jgi:Ku protein
MALPRAYWKGSLKLSLVSCPVLLYPASTSVDKTRFHMINKETGNRLKQQMVDAETGDVVESDQKGRGYELKKGEYVEVEKDELEAVQIEATISSTSKVSCPGARSTSATSITPITSRLMARPASMLSLSSATP